ncbi:MAG: hypothetical protein EHM18_12035 [Acidobacteria bacterium]|nr:MAG: hypothetical protein EHM18_12035 [Acidobacteriota bacterium]
MANTVEEIKGALESAVIALGDLTAEGEKPDPYVADAQSFANQAAYCLGKQIEVKGGDTSLKPTPAKGGKRDRDKTA